MSIYKNGIWKEDKINELDNKNISGENIDILDSANSILKEFNIEGKTEQKSTQGNQQWDYFSYPTTQTINGVTITNNKDGTITLDGECDTDNTVVAVGTGTFVKNLAAEGSITHTAYYISGTCTGYAVIRVNYNQSNSMIRLENLQASTKLTKTQAQSTATSGWSWGFRIDSDAKFNNFRFRYQLNKGSSELTWEEYTNGVPSPNPSYPQAINSVGDNVNYLPIDVVSETTNGVTVTRLNDGTFKLNGTTTANTFLILYNGENVTLPAGTYTGSIGNRTNIVDGYIRKGEWGAYKTIFDSTHDTNTFTIDEPFIFNRFYIYINNNKTFNNQIIKPELSLGTLVKPYAPHNSYNIGSMSIEKCNKNRYSSELELGSINTTTGQNSANDNCVRSKDYIGVLPKTRFTISNDKNYDNVIYQYDSNKDFIRVDSLGSGTQTFTTQPTCYYIRNRTSFGNVQNDLTTKFQLEQGSVATPYSPYNMGVATIEKCNKNLFDDNSLIVGKIPSVSTGELIDSDSSHATTDLIKINNTKNYALSGTTTNNSNIYIFYYRSDKTYISAKSFKGTINHLLNEDTEFANSGFVRIRIDDLTNIQNIQLEQNSQATTYIAHQSETYNIYTQAPMRAIGDVRDDFIKQAGVWYERHKIGHIASYNGETIETAYMSTTGELSTGAEVIYVLAEPTLTQCTSEQVEQIEAIINDGTYQGGTHYFSNDEIKPLMNIIYFRDWDKNLQTKNQIYEDKILSNKFIEI